MTEDALIRWVGLVPVVTEHAVRVILGGKDAMNEAMNRQVTVIRCRWGDVQVGDVVLDDRWKQRSWEEVKKIEHNPGYTVAWWRKLDGPGYRTGPNELVNVQVVGR